MRTTEKRFAVSTFALAVRGALIAICAAPAMVIAEDESDDVSALINPLNFVEAGAANVSKGSAKFGEYNGLNKKGGYFLGNFGLRGGDAYGQGTGTMRWEVKGNDIGTTSRSVGASVSDQGTWSLGIGYDELRHNITDSFQTPYQGSQGSNNFTLPSNFGLINTTAPGARSLLPAQQAAFHTEDVHSDRKNLSFNAGYIFNPRWDMKFEYNHLDQSGSKLIGSGTDKYVSGATTFGGETIAILMNPTEYKTDTFNLALNWSEGKAHATLGYYGSFFHDDYRGMSWQGPMETGTATGNTSVAIPYSTMSTPPSNQFHQLNFTGGYAFTSATKLTGGFSYARNTQNESFDGTYTPGRVLGLPTSSLNGLVVTTHADLKLTNQTTKDLVLSAGVKYNERDNRTDSNIYRFYDLGTTTGGTAASVFNIPMSNRRTQMEIAGDYRIDKQQNLHIGYDYDHIRRWCNNSAPASVLTVNPSGATAAGYYGMSGSDCAQVPQSSEDKLVLGYRLRATDDVNVTAGYSYGKRRSDVNSSFYNPMQGNSQGFENYGYVAFFDASRTQQMLKAGVNWQVTEQLNLSLNGRYTKDNYDDSTLGVQEGHSSSINLDATYNFSENNSISAYTTWQERNRDLINAAGRNVAVLLTQQWTNHLSDRDNTVGLGAKQKGLFGGRLQLAEDLTYSNGKSGYSTDVPYALATCTATSNLSCGAVPDIKSEMLQFKFSGSYQISKPSKIVMGYMYQRLKSDDPAYYNIYQYGYTATSILPTNQQAPNYNVNMLFVAYNYSFR